MTDDTEPTIRPTLRDLRVEHTQQDGRPGVALSDPYGIAKGPIFVPDGLLPIVGRFDGTKTVAEIQAELEAAPGQELPSNLVAGLAAQFDEMKFLEGPAFRAEFDQVVAAFANQGTRPSPLAGITAGYPADAADLSDALESIVHRPTEGLRAPPRGLIAPHIDIGRGREGYSMAYSALAECEPADLYVVFGTGHNGPSAPVTGLRLDWETPLGTVRTDREFVDGIHERLGAPDPRDVLLHRDEHSIEFQVLFLQHVLRGHDFAVAGFLTGHLFPTDGPIGDSAPAKTILTAFREAAAASGKRVCFVGGADLAHIGPFFGDATPVDDTRLDQLASDELPKLQHLENADPDAFHAAVERGGNTDRICGTTPMYLTSALAGGAARLLHYGQAQTTDGSQTVSY